MKADRRIPSDTQPTLDDLITEVESNRDLTTHRRRDMVSALRTVARILDRSPAEVPANAAWLRRKLNDVHPRQARISPKRYANIKSELAAALRQSQFPEKRSLRGVPLSPEWERLKDLMPKGERQWQLSRFFRYCSARGIAPDSVDDAVAGDFRQVLEEDSLAKNLDEVYRRTVRAWNYGVASIPSWPQRRLTLQRNFQRWTYPLAAFPIPFRRDVGRWQIQLSRSDPFSTKGPPRALSRTTIANHRVHIRAFASALVHSGEPIENIRSLAYLTDLERFTKALRFFVRRADGKMPTGLSVMASTIKSIARHYVEVDSTHLEQLRRITSRIPAPSGGLTDKNRERLRPFDDPQNIISLIELPRRLFERSKAQPQGNYMAALDAQKAVAIEILLMSPLRAKNLANISLERHLTWQRPGCRGQLYINIPRQDVKNREPIEVLLPEDTSDRVRDYAKNYRPLVCKVANEWLFPGREGEAKSTACLAEQVKKTIRKETGLVVNAHLFRHLGALLYLNRQPGDYETVRRVLAHRKTDTTTSFYAGFEGKAATRHYDEVILAYRDAEPREGSKRRPRP